MVDAHAACSSCSDSLGSAAPGAHPCMEPPRTEPPARSAAWEAPRRKLRRPCRRLAMLASRAALAAAAPCRELTSAASAAVAVCVGGGGGGGWGGGGALVRCHTVAGSACYKESA